MEAVRQNSPSIIVSHCHPSGNASPSPEDVKTTSLLYKAGKILSIQLLDHVIIGNNQLYVTSELGAGVCIGVIGEGEQDGVRNRFRKTITTFGATIAREGLEILETIIYFVEQ